MKKTFCPRGWEFGIFLGCDVDPGNGGRGRGRDVLVSAREARMCF